MNRHTAIIDNTSYGHFLCEYEMILSNQSIESKGRVEFMTAQVIRFDIVGDKQVIGSLISQGMINHAHVLVIGDDNIPSVYDKMFTNPESAKIGVHKVIDDLIKANAVSVGGAIPS